MSAVSLAVSSPLPYDPECTLLTPASDVADPELSIVIPAMNERLTIGDTIEWCLEGFRKANVVGEVLIIDSSTDETPQIALAHGARVLKTPRRGLGRAYIDAIPYIRANYILMGDADCTYDFREIGEFVREFRSGFEFIMGSRFRGYIEEGAMPPLHRHFGTPLTTAILNFLYSSKFSDIHCGMRGITKAALQKIRLESQSWEYASEMVLKSACLSLRTTEVPVRFLKDREGRSSHMKRGGFFEPWRAGWINLRAMFIYHADFFVLAPRLDRVSYWFGVGAAADLRSGQGWSHHSLVVLDPVRHDTRGRRSAELFPGLHRASHVQLLAEGDEPLGAVFFLHKGHDRKRRACARRSCAGHSARKGIHPGEDWCCRTGTAAPATWLRLDCYS